MKTNRCILIFAVLAILMSFVSCKLPDGTSMKILMLADGDFDDDSFNENCKEGLERAVEELGVTAEYFIIDNMTSLDSTLDRFVDGGYDLIITNGFLFADGISDVAVRQPDVKFAMVDYAYETTPANVNCIVFSADEAAFPLGYLAAAWAELQDHDNASVAYVGGMDIPPVRQWTDSFCTGADYYNSMHNASVTCSGEFADDFYDEQAGRDFAESLIEGGADVILGCGGQAGTGGLLQAQEMGRWGIGVDKDMHEVLPEIHDSILSSGIKRFDKGVYAVVESVVAGEFDGGGVYQGNLANGGITLAPYYDFEDEIPQEIQSEIDVIIEGIKDGTIETGW
jgi:basic membrane protein A